MTTTQPDLHPEPAIEPRPHRRWVPYLLAALLVLGAGIGIVVMSALADAAVTSALGAATHGSSRGLTVSTHPDPYYVYSVDGTPVTGITVTAPDGSKLPVTMTDSSFTYGPHKEGLQIGTFEVPAGNGMSDYRVIVTSDQAGELAVAVTTFDVAAFNLLKMTGAISLLTINLGVAGVLVIRAARS